MLKFFRRTYKCQECLQTSVRSCAKKQMGGNGAHRASVFNLWSLQSNGDAVQEDEGQHNIVKELVSNDGLAEEAKPAREFSRHLCLGQSKVKKHEDRELRGLAKTVP